MSSLILIIYFGIFVLTAAAIVIIFGLDKKLSINHTRRKKAGTIKHRKQSRFIKLARLEQKRRQILSQAMVSGPVYWAMTILGAGCGAVVGRIFFQASVFSLAIGIHGAIAPLFWFQYKATHMRGRQVEKIQSTMMILSNSYIVTEDFIKSVQDNIDLLEYSAPFLDFLTFVTLINGNITTGLRRLELQVDNVYFSQWIDVLIMSQDDRSLKYVTMSVVDAMNDVRQAQRETDTAMYAIWHEYITVLILIFAVPMIFRILMPVAYTVLVTTLPGQVLLALLIVAVVYSLIKAVRLNKPLLV